MEKEGQVNIGYIINKVIAEKGAHKNQLAERLGVSAGQVVYLTNKKIMDVHYLHKISNALRYNFFQHFPVDEEKTDDPDKDKIIEELNEKVVALEQQVAEMKLLEMKYIKQSNDDLRLAQEVYLASVRPTLRLRSTQPRRKILPGNNNERLMIEGK